MSAAATDPQTGLVVLFFFFLRSVNGFPLLCLVHTHTYTFSPLKTVHNNQGRTQHRGTHTRGTVSFLPMMPRRGFPIVCALLCVLFFPVNHTLAYTCTHTFTHSRLWEENCTFHRTGCERDERYQQEEQRKMEKRRNRVVLD